MKPATVPIIPSVKQKSDTNHPSSAFEYACRFLEHNPMRQIALLRRDALKK